jgi:hypothetical protein
MILNSLLMLRASINTIETLKDRFSRYNYDPTLVLMTDETLSTAYQETLEDSKLQLLKAESLYKCLQGASALLSDLLPYQNASSLKSIAEDSHSDNTIMRQLTEQTTKDSSSIKTITIITVLFLPATVVAVGTLSPQKEKLKLTFLPVFLLHTICPDPGGQCSPIRQDLDIFCNHDSSHHGPYRSLVVPPTGHILDPARPWKNQILARADPDTKI